MIELKLFIDRNGRRPFSNSLIFKSGLPLLFSPVKWKSSEIKLLTFIDDKRDGQDTAAVSRCKGGSAALREQGPVGNFAVVYNNDSIAQRVFSAVAGADLVAFRVSGNLEPPSCVLQKFVIESAVEL